MKLKIILVVVGTITIGASIIFALQRTEDRRVIEASRERVSIAMSNYTHTFKLNTNPPIWPEAPKK